MVWNPQQMLGPQQMLPYMAMGGMHPALRMMIQQQMRNQQPAAQPPAPPAPTPAPAISPDVQRQLDEQRRRINMPPPGMLQQPAPVAPNAPPAGAFVPPPPPAAKGSFGFLSRPQDMMITGSDMLRPQPTAFSSFMR